MDNQNIARGTTDPGYWVYNSNHFYDRNQSNKQINKQANKTTNKQTNKQTNEKQTNEEMN